MYLLHMDFFRSLFVTYTLQGLAQGPNSVILVVPGLEPLRNSYLTSSALEVYR